MTSPSIVRAAVPEDKAELWRLLRLLWAENGMCSISERKVDLYLDRLLNPSRYEQDDGGPRGIIGVIGPVGSLEAAIMLAFGSPWYSDEITLDEHLNFVDPAHRNSDHAKTLIAYAKHMVDQIRPAHPEFKLVIGVLSTHRTAAKVRLYERQLTPSGAFFVYPPPENISPLKSLYRTR